MQGHQKRSQELKVALSYLDQLRHELADQPQVHEDVVDTILESKSQSLDVRGVAQRVSHLLRGYPKLIAGFNRFLPPPYRIEEQSNEQDHGTKLGKNMCSGGVSTSPLNLCTRPVTPPSATRAIHPKHPLQSHHIESSDSSPGNSTTKNPFQVQPKLEKQFLETIHSIKKEQIELEDNPFQVQPQIEKPFTETIYSIKEEKMEMELEDPHTIRTQGPQKQLEWLAKRVGNCQSFIDQVRAEFHNQPEVLNYCLTTMKEFNARRIDVPTLVRRFSHLFQSHPELITGLNRFLPPGYRIEVQQVRLSIPGTSMESGGVGNGPSSLTINLVNPPKATGTIHPHLPLQLNR